MYDHIYSYMLTFRCKTAKRGVGEGWMGRQPDGGLSLALSFHFYIKISKYRHIHTYIYGHIYDLLGTLYCSLWLKHETSSIICRDTKACIFDNPEHQGLYLSTACCWPCMAAYRHEYTIECTYCPIVVTVRHAWRSVL